MGMTWSILYRGPLSSCNYACGYCPFAKRPNTREELRLDEASLRRFSEWVETRSEQIGILFTPWGEALVHRYYQQALSHLSRLSQVRRVAIQTNLACRLEWLEQADPARLALWCTFHPSEVSLERFLAQCRRLDARGIRYSVGMVGVKENFSWMEPLRAGLAPGVYLWINAFKREPNYYSEKEIEWLTGLDRLFPLNNRSHSSRGRRCQTGYSVFSVDGDGDMRRCHFVEEVIGNIYGPGFEAGLFPRTCPKETCGCHIGYLHLEELRLEKVFGQGLLERIPENLS